MDKYIKQMKEILKNQNEDQERAHSEADTILCEALKELGYHELVEAYEKIDKWCA